MNRLCRLDQEIIYEVRRLLRNPKELEIVARQKLGNRRKLKYSKGDYKTSAQNIQRLLWNEATKYYRLGFLNKLSQDPNTKGFEIFLSPEHKVTDICDLLAGEYPTDFYYTNWHIGCKCSIRAITGGKKITDVPRNFTAWVIGNQERILNAKNLPDWISENGKYLPDENYNLDIEINKLIVKAQNSESDVLKLLNYFNDKLKGYSTSVNFKSKNSILRKVTSELNGDVGLVKDAVRATVILPIKDYQKLVNYLEKSGIFERVKYQTPDKFSGYSGIITNFKTSNGITAEIQFNTEKMIFAKEKPADAIRIMGEKRWREIEKEIGLKGGLGHEFYEKIRTLPKTDPKRLEFERLSIEYYKYFR